MGRGGEGREARGGKGGERGEGKGKMKRSFSSLLLIVINPLANHSQTINHSFKIERFFFSSSDSFKFSSFI